MNTEQRLTNLEKARDIDNYATKVLESKLDRDTEHFQHELDRQQNQIDILNALLANAQKTQPEDPFDEFPPIQTPLD